MHIRFEDSYPVLVEIAKSELKFVRSERESSPESDEVAVRSVKNSILYTLQQWRSEFARNYEAIVTVRLQTDPSLGEDDRAYLVRHNSSGVVEEITITGPRPGSR